MAIKRSKKVVTNKKAKKEVADKTATSKAKTSNKKDKILDESLPEKQALPAVSKKDELADLIADTLNKKNKGYKVAYFLDGKDATPTDLSEFIGTGSSTLDIAISNRPHGGLPVGRIIELTGLEASGKSLLAGHILANTQKKGGLAVYIDTESAINEDFLDAIGVDIDGTKMGNKLLYISLETIEDIFDAVESMIEQVRKSNKDRLVTIVVDSVAGATTKVEKESDFSKDGWATSKAIVLSKAMRKITHLIARERILLVFTNQLRTKLGVMFGDPWCVDPITTKIKIKYKI